MFFFFRMNKGGLSIGLHSLPSILSKSSSGKSRSIFKGRLFILGLFFILATFWDFSVPASLLFCFSVFCYVVLPCFSLFLCVYNFLLLCVSTFLFFCCFASSSLLLCLSTFLLSPVFFSSFSAFCFSLFLCLPALLLLCFSRFLFLTMQVILKKHLINSYK